MENVIELHGLTKIYNQEKSTRGKKAIDNLNLVIPRGSIFGLLGPNGAGKSTVINILAGLTVKDSGKVLICGHDQDLNPRQTRFSIGVVPQELNLDPFLTPHSALEVQAGLYGIRKKHRQTNEILKAIGLLDKADAYSRSLSGGMRRRLLIGKALVHSPQVLVLDEPTAGVDIELRELLWKHVKSLNEQGTTIVLTTHYLEEAQKLCDRITILDQGCVVASGKTEDLLSKMDQKTLIIKTSSSISVLPKVSNNVQLSLNKFGDLVFSYHRSKTDAEELIDACRNVGLKIDEISTLEPDLKDVFISALKK